MLKPKFFSMLKGITKEQVISDITAGTIVGIIALPLAIAFGIASGVTPEQGLITAIIGGFLISFLGGSRVQIGGPTGAFIIIVYQIVQVHGINGLLLATFMAGIILIIMGFARLGSVIKFIPYPVTVGFTSGIAVVIFSSQINDIMGLNIANVPADFIEKWKIYFESFAGLNYSALIIGITSLLIMIYWPKVSRKIPGSIIAILLSIAAVQILNLNVETIGSRFGDIQAAIPSISLPYFDLETIKSLIIPATTIALLAAIEALLSAVVADGMIGGKHRSNMELIAQGVANIFSPLFGGIPVTGAIARTAANIKNGGRTPIAGITHAIVLLLITLFFGKWAKLIPMTTLAAILIIVSYNMSEWRSFKALLKSPRSDVAVLITTFFLTVVFDLTIAIEVGMVLAVLLFMRRMSMVTNIEIISKEMEDEEEPVDQYSIDRRSIPDEVEVYEINGPFFFGAASKFKEAIKVVENPPKIRIIRMRNVSAIDATGMHIFKEFYKDSVAKGTKIILSGVQKHPMNTLRQAGLIETIGQENIFNNIDEALERAKTILNSRNN